MFAFGEPWSRVQSRTKLSGRVNSERKLCGEKTSRGKKEGGRGGEENFREGDRYKSFNGFERAVSRAAAASFALRELSKNKINYGTGAVFMRSSAREEGKSGEVAAP